MNIEIERKFKVTEADFPFFKETLLANNFIHKGKKQIVDEYYVVKTNDEYLRIRHTTPPTLDHHKMVHNAENACEEREVQISDVKMMHHILTRLGHKVVVTVDKIRHTYENDRVEVVLDHIKGLGHFVEVEVKGGTYDDMNTTVALLNLTNEIQKEGYPDLLLKIKKT